jgi:hypothetical protein
MSMRMRITQSIPRLAVARLTLNGSSACREPDRIFGNGTSAPATITISG